MRATEILKNEHEVIVSHLRSLRHILKNNEFEGIYTEIPHFFEFIKNYSDDFHHAKEENIYFKWMLKQNPGLEYGPIKCMIDEHKQFREHIDIALKSYESFTMTMSEKDKRCCCENLNKFIDKLLVHIEKEDNILYKIADSLDYEVSSGDDEMLPLFNKVQRDYQDKIKKFL